MPRFFLGNFDFEEQLRGESHPSKPLKRLLLELAPCWLAAAEPDDRIWCPGELPEEFLESLESWELPREVFVSEYDRIPRGLELVPWGWSSEAIAFGNRYGLIIKPPSLDVVRFVNSREYSVLMEQQLDVDKEGCEKPAAQLCTSLSEIQSRIERLATESRWVIKANWSHAARERLQGRGPMVSVVEAHWIQKRLDRDGIVCWEPWLQRHSEIGIQWQIAPGHAPELIAITELLVDSRGQYLGSRSLTQNKLPDWIQIAIEATVPVVDDLARRGYFGPVGIDAMRFTLPDGQTSRTRALQDINARWTMGRLAAEWFNRIDSPGPMSWLHGIPADSLDAGIPSPQLIPTSPSIIDRIPVSHRSWLCCQSSTSQDSITS